MATAEVPTLAQDAAHVKTMESGDALESAARAFERHSGPASTERERALFGQDLRAAAMRYARAYYAEARAYGLIPQPWLAPGHPRHIWRGNVEGACLTCGSSYGAHDVDDNCPTLGGPDAR